MATLKVAFLTLRVRFHNFPAFQYFLLVRHVLQTVSTVFFPSPHPSPQTHAISFAKRRKTPHLNCGNARNPLHAGVPFIY